MACEESKTYIAIPPGETIKEQLEIRQMTQKEFAKRMDLSEKHISKLLNGDVMLTQDVARRLEMVLNVPAYFWNNLESRYREKLLLVEQENNLEEETNILKNLPFNEMKKLHWIDDNSKSNIDKIISLRKFFEVSSLSLISLVPPRTAWRRKDASEKSKYSTLAWLQKVKLEARNIETDKINLNKLNKQIPIFREMTCMNPTSFIPRLKNVLAECGIAFVILPQIKGSYLNGAAFKEKNKIILGVTLRGKYADQFWFTFFHELAHILYEHVNLSSELTSKEETKADKFAQDILIPSKQYNHFITQKKFSKTAVMSFANEIGIDPGIVVGRLQKEKLITYKMLNELKTKYELN